MSLPPRLTAADESLTHQIIETFHTVADSTPSWTEKVWVSVFSPDGAVQVDFGVGKYTNRGVMDGFGGVSRGVEQWTLRASRELGDDVESVAVGPLEYSVVEPLKQVRVRLMSHDRCAISFDLLLTGVLPPFFEDRHERWDPTRTRRTNDVLRYHQAVTVTGVVRIGDDVIEVQDWVGFRDHSWGIRRNVGNPPSDLKPARKSMTESSYAMHWCPLLVQDGESTFELHYFLEYSRHGRIYLSAYRNDADGTQTPAEDVMSDLRFDPRTRRLIGGSVSFAFSTGTTELSITPMSETGFMLATGLYIGYRGRHHGSWVGELSVDYDYIADCTLDESVAELGQLRDCVVSVHGADGQTGVGIIETIVPRQGETE